MKKYNLINNALGWLCFAIAAVTYILTLEPTASFWDCPEFITQGSQMEIGHPPGNPIFMLVARFFVNFAFGDVTKFALMVNLMSALLSAGTILLLFWTITHLVKRLVVADDATEVSLTKMLVIFGSGLCGALMYTWSDTFWFSAVEAEVYAFSSFCTALVFWLILKWESRADQPHSDKYLILIAYIIGISIAVHLLNLLCIPAIVLVVYYKKWRDTTAKGSLLALFVSFVLVALILYGLVPGFIGVSQQFELLFVNHLGMGFHSGVIVYAAVLVACLIWTIRNLYKQTSVKLIRISMLLSLALSGAPFIGGSFWIGLALLAAAAIYLFKVKRLPIRILNLAAISILVIFIGYSSYALLLIRSSAHTPMNQNAPDNVFALASYLNREQYGDRPLLYGETMNSMVVYDQNDKPIKTKKKDVYGRSIKTSPDDKDHYEIVETKWDYTMSPELNMLFPRMYSSQAEHKKAYGDWIGGFEGRDVEATTHLDTNTGESIQKERVKKPTMLENISYFLNYQLNHMYWRYFMWNFAGRQNDIASNGEVNHGNWISGIPFIDNPRLGDQSLLPDDMGKGNPGHNVFFLLPLLMGIIGLGWQAFISKRGIEQFWVVFFLFFMTGIAIVIYLNQTPGQPRERDYAFAGSFYAFAIWVGMGVAGLWQLLTAIFADKKATTAAPTPQAPDPKSDRKPLIFASIAVVIGLIVPLQVVSQTWDDHDRSGRYTARDFGFNYLQSLDENAVIFTNGDNDTFPLWYAQEVEGVRTDVKVVNLSYLTTDWYIDQIRRDTYDAKGLEMQIRPENYAHNRMQYVYVGSDTTLTDALTSLRHMYSPEGWHPQIDAGVMYRPRMFIPIDTAAMIKAGRISPADAKNAEPAIFVNFAGKTALYNNQYLPVDILATSAANGWNRPVYFATTVPESYYIGLDAYMQCTGLAYEVTPFYNTGNDMGVNTEKMYRNVTERFRWGGLDKATKPSDFYADETIRRMITSHRGSMLDLATALYKEGVLLYSEAGVDSIGDTNINPEIKARIDDKFQKALNVLDLMREKLPTAVVPFGFQLGAQTADLYDRIGRVTKNPATVAIGQEILRDEISRFAQNIIYYQSLPIQKYQTLQRMDKYIDQIGFMDMIMSYSELYGDAPALIDELEARGVDFNRLYMLYPHNEGAEQ